MASGLIFAVQFAAAQFPIKIPTINKPKVEQPKTDQPNTDGDSFGANQNPSKVSKDGVGHMPKPRPTSVPVLLKDTLEIKTYTGNTYWKFPKEQYYSSWTPLINSVDETGFDESGALQNLQNRLDAKRVAD